MTGGWGLVCGWGWGRGRGWDGLLDFGSGGGGLDAECFVVVGVIGVEGAGGVEGCWRS